MPNYWAVEYVGHDGRRYNKLVKAPDEMTAYMRVMGIEKEGAN